MPGPSYFAALDELHRAQYRQALRGMQSELNSAVRTVQTRWIDSICYHAMLGETLYQVGDNQAAMEQLDRSILLFLDNSGWLNSITFQLGPQPDTNRARRLPAWARPQLPTTYGNLPSSFLVGIGQIDNSAVTQNGGVVRQAQFWKLDAQEVARTIAWAIYRRGQMLGPLAKHDALQTRLIDTISRGGLAPRGHWSNAWVELWWGMASASVGDATSAVPHFQRSMLLEGRYHHDLTGLAFLGQGLLAQSTGNPSAGKMFREAYSSAIAFEDFTLLGEVVNSLTVQDAIAPGSVVPIDYLETATWVRRGGLSHTAAQIELQIVERLLINNQAAPATKRLGAAFGRRREAEASRLGPYGKFLSARLQAGRGNLDDAIKLLNQAMESQLGSSLRNYQINLTNLRIDQGTLSARLAREVYAELLNDPSQYDWLKDPLESMVSLRTDHNLAFDRWFAIALSRRDTVGSFSIVDQQRRRAFFRARPYAGRLESIRRLLEAKEEELNPNELTARALLEDRLPIYAENREIGLAIQREIRGMESLFEESAPQRTDKKKFDTFSETVRVRETQLRQLALSRAWVPMTFPSAYDEKASRRNLAPGEAMVVFHESRGEFYGLLLVGEGENGWRIGNSKLVEEKVISLLRVTAGGSRDQEWTYEMLESEAWKQEALALSSLLFDGSRIDTKKLNKLTIVPDGILWHVPFNVLSLGSEETCLVDAYPLRLSPTPGLALAPHGVRQPVQNTVLITDKVRDEDSPRDPMDDLTANLKIVYPGSKIPSEVLKGAVDHLVVDIDLMLESDSANDLDPIPLARKRYSGLSAWRELPYQAPSGLVLASLHTEAELIPKLARRGSSKRRMSRPGNELFEATCSLLAGGTKNLLLTSWVTGGKCERELIKEYLVGLRQEGASEAWQRSVSLARTQPITTTREPRVVDPDDDGETSPPDASHPFFWGGFLLVE